MKIAICVTGSNLQSMISAVFGRCPSFLLVDSQDKTKKFEVLNNPALEAGRGAGVAASQTLASHGVKAVICGGVGPNAFSVLQSAGVTFYLASLDLTAEEAVSQFQKGTLKKVSASTQVGHFGSGPRGGQGRRF